MTIWLTRLAAASKFPRRISNSILKATTFKSSISKEIEVSWSGLPIFQIFPVFQLPPDCLFRWLIQSTALLFPHHAPFHLHHPLDFFLDNNFPVRTDMHFKISRMANDLFAIDTGLYLFDQFFHFYRFRNITIHPLRQEFFPITKYFFRL